jgi:hypothetical protein
VILKYPYNVEACVNNIPPFAISFPDFPSVRPSSDTETDVHSVAKRELMKEINLRCDAYRLVPPPSEVKPNQRSVDLSQSESERILEYNDALKGHGHADE